MNMKNYGVSSFAEISKLPEIQKKKVITCKKNFGVAYPQQSDVVRKKSIETVLKKYGVDNISKLPETTPNPLLTFPATPSTFLHSPILSESELATSHAYT